MVNYVNGLKNYAFSIWGNHATTHTRVIYCTFFVLAHCDSGRCWKAEGLSLPLDYKYFDKVFHIVLPDQIWISISHGKKFFSMSEISQEVLICLQSVFTFETDWKLHKSTFLVKIAIEIIKCNFSLTIEEFAWVFLFLEKKITMIMIPVSTVQKF